MTEGVDYERRRFLGIAAMTIAAAHVGLYRVVNGKLGGPDELAALDGAGDWINSPRLSPSSLAGKVVLVQFWTYTCINWLRTLPYTRAWASKYRDRLVVIGVHTPEFGFERDANQVRRAVRQMGIEYPVATDNNYAVWRGFSNHSWPALYLLDGRGRVRHQHFGEGEYDASERAIQRVLAEAGAPAGSASVVSVDGVGAEAPADWANLRSPENYTGYERTEHFASGSAEPGRRRRYAIPKHLALNQWAVAGEWTIGTQATVLNAANGRMAYRFHARDLHLVMGPPQPGQPIRFRVSIDGQAPGPAHGADTDAGGAGVVAEPRLYQLIRQPKPIVDRQFEVEFLDPGVQTFAFTFG